MSEDSDDDAHGDDEDDNQHEDEIGDGKSIKWNAIKRNEFIFPFRALWPDNVYYLWGALRGMSSSLDNRQNRVPVASLKFINAIISLTATALVCLRNTKPLFIVTSAIMNEETARESFYSFKALLDSGVNARPRLNMIWMVRTSP